MLRIAEHFHDSDLGRQRQGNEDNYYVRAPLFVVADGMGGAQAGEVASELAVRQFEEGLPDGRTPGEALSELIRSANAEIHSQARDDPDPDHHRRRPPRARTIHLHLPEHWPWQAGFDNLFTAVQSAPG